MCTARAHGRVKAITFKTLTVDRLRGVWGTATCRNRPYRLVVIALPSNSGRRVVLVTVTIHNKATARDVAQAGAFVSGLRVRVS